MSYEDNEIKKYNDRIIEDGIRRKEEDATFDLERYNRELIMDVVAKQFLLEQEEKKRRTEEVTSQYFLDRELEREEFESKTSQYLLEQELQRIEKSKTKKYESLESFVQEILGKYPLINLKDFYQILSEKQSSKQYIRNFSNEELINKYFASENNQGRRR